ncbi:HD-GYP domain-containing protein [Alkalihalobacillus sp. BA299]|uniref:HD-GYP domain-containing protein n=1 Tax=Alkalihalobacillus sp. BA299 TaxID=2815938 RepID=UPI001ADBC140|nr:HD domain-containing phosphohydrolase [Alkalihalobacillus sp. BA299]
MKLSYIEKEVKIKTNIHEQYRHLIVQLQEHNYITYQHSIRVGNLLSLLGLRLGFSLKKTETLYIIGILHDIGKIHVPNRILNKSGKLTLNEWNELQLHPEYGIKLLKNIPLPSEVLSAIAAHHENLDGSGYPSGLTGDDIPYFAKMTRVVDSYDAMTYSRPYRKEGMSDEHAIIELKRGIGTFYEKEILDGFCEIIKENGKTT